MGISDRDYERNWDQQGNAFRGGGFELGAKRSANTNLLLALVAVYVVQVVTLDGGTPPQSWFTNLFVLPSDWLSRPWRAYGLVTYGLLHDPQHIGHLLFNGIALFFFGRTIESRYGPREYLTFFFAGVLFSGAVWTASEMFSQGAGSVLLGASGGIAAVLILFALNYPNQKIFIWGVLPMPAWLLAVLFVGVNVFNATGHADASNVAYTAHLGGALFGYLYFRNGWRLARFLPGGEGKFQFPSFKRRPKLKIHRDTEAADGIDQQVDEILKKIQEQGQESLSKKEQQLLAKASQRYQRKNQ